MKFNHTAYIFYFVFETASNSIAHVALKSQKINEEKKKRQIEMQRYDKHCPFF